MLHDNATEAMGRWLGTHGGHCRIDRGGMVPDRRPVCKDAKEDSIALMAQL